MGSIGGGPRALHHVAVRQGGPAPPHGVGPAVPSSDSSLDSVFVSGKIGAWLFVSSNFENISLITFLKQKTAENRQLSLWHLVNRLVS